MITIDPEKRTLFMVTWPVQGIFRFRSQDSELILSHVYWLWIWDALSEVRDDGQQLPFVEAVDNGFNDPRNLVETLPVTPRLLEVLRQVPPSRAPSFELLIPFEECPKKPTPEQILAEFTKVFGEALSSGTIEMEFE